MPRRTPRPTPPVPIERVEAAVHELIRAIAPELRREKKWGMPWYAGTDLVVLPIAFAHHVGVEFWRGTSLKDRHHLLEGTGHNLRHVKVKTLPEATSPDLIELLREAVDLDRAEPPRPRSTPRGALR